jgi:ferredoxin
LEAEQPTVAGLAVGERNCPRCGECIEVRPADFREAVEKSTPARTVDEMIQWTNEASRIVSTWYRSEPYATLVQHRGVRLAEAAERFLLAHVTQGMLASAFAPPAPVEPASLGPFKSSSNGDEETRRNSSGPRLEAGP